MDLPLLNSTAPLNPYWVAGFTTGDGCFSIYLEKSSSHKLGLRVKPQFRISQDSQHDPLGRGKLFRFRTPKASFLINQV
jgi:hypothetical protein